MASDEELLFPWLTPELFEDDEVLELDVEPLDPESVLVFDPESVLVLDPASVLVLVSEVLDCSCPTQNPAPVIKATTSPPMLTRELVVLERRPFGLMPMTSPCRPHEDRTGIREDPERRPGHRQAPASANLRTPTVCLSAVSDPVSQ